MFPRRIAGEGAPVVASVKYSDPRVGRGRKIPRDVARSACLALNPLIEFVLHSRLTT